MTGKTVPELSPLSAPVLDTDVVAVYRSPGPLRRTTVSEISSGKMNTNMSNVAAAIGSVSVNPAYSGVGTATSGTPRVYFGTLTPTNDDSAICIGRNIIGNLLFSHCIRDESDFLSTGDSAYASFDAFTNFKTNGSLKYNHGYGYQWRSRMAATNGMDLFAGFTSFPIVSAGTVDRLYHYHVQGQNFTGGTVSQHVGLYISPISGGTGVNYGIYVQSNPSFFGGDCQFNGIINGASRIDAGQINATGGISAYSAGGGVLLARPGSGSDYAVLRSYINGSGSPIGLAVNPAGGQILIGAATPATGSALEVTGAVAMTDANLTGALYVDAIKVVGNQGAAVADATDAASVIARLNDLLARLRTHGLIAT